MSELEIDSKSPSRRLKNQLANAPELEQRVGRCLIVAQASNKRDLVERAAADAGWETIVCRGAAEAAQEVERSRFEFAWVDTVADGAGEIDAEQARLRDVCQCISALPNVLLVVCGRENDPQEEIWARQLGVWLYLPGVSLDHPEEIAMLCEQAHEATGNSQSSFL